MTSSRHLRSLVVITVGLCAITATEATRGSDSLLPLSDSVHFIEKRRVLEELPRHACPAWGPDNDTAQGLTSLEREAATAKAGLAAAVDRHDAVFGELSPDEYNAVHAFLLSHDRLQLVNTGTAEWRARMDESLATLAHLHGGASSGAAEVKLPKGASGSGGPLMDALSGAADLMKSSYVHAIWREAPAKAAALAYLNGTSTQPPPRKARVMVVLAGADHPRIEEVLVTIDRPAALGAGGGAAKSGSERTTVANGTARSATSAPRVHSLERVPLEGTRGTTPSLPLAYHPYNSADVLGVYAAVAKEMPVLNDFLAATFSGRRLCGSSGNSNNTAKATTDACTSCVFIAYSFNYQIRNRNASGVASDDDSKAISRSMESVFGVRREGGNKDVDSDCAAVEPLQAMLLPLEFIAESNDPGLSDWTITGWWFNGRFYGSIADLLKSDRPLQDSTTAEEKEARPKTAASPAADGSTYAREFLAPRPDPKRGAVQPLGPLPHEPYGRRFTLSAGTSPRVRWLGWETTIGYKATSGPRFWDIRFKGERIAYELSMQEISCGKWRNIVPVGSGSTTEGERSFFASVLCSHFPSSPSLFSMHRLWCSRSCYVG